MLVGNGSGGADRDRLRYAVNDVAGVKSILTGVCGFREPNIIALYNKSPADLDAILPETVARFTDDAGGNVFLFYYSGHADGRDLLMGDQR